MLRQIATRPAGRSQFGAEPIARTPEEFAAFTRAKFEKFGELVKAAGIQPE